MLFTLAADYTSACFYSNMFFTRGNRVINPLSFNPRPVNSKIKSYTQAYFFSKNASQWGLIQCQNYPYCVS